MNFHFFWHVLLVSSPFRQNIHRGMGIAVAGYVQWTPIFFLALCVCFFLGEMGCLEPGGDSFHSNCLAGETASWRLMKLHYHRTTHLSLLFGCPERLWERIWTCWFQIFSGVYLSRYSGCAFRVGRTIRDDKEMTYWILCLLGESEKETASDDFVVSL